jgi:hypothetical protein
MIWSIAAGWWVLVFGVGRGSKGGNESAAAPARSGSHVEHEPAFFKMQWPTTSSQQQQQQQQQQGAATSSSHVEICV